MNKQELLAYHKTLMYRIVYKVYDHSGVLLVSSMANGDYDQAERMEADYFRLMREKKGCTKRSWYQRDALNE